MGFWDSKPNRHLYKGFIEVSEGDHRAQISNVRVEEFNSGKKCFEITLKVSHNAGKIWYYLWFDPNDKQKNSKSFQSFFRSFKINDYNLLHYEKWIGKYGAIRVKHEKDDEYDVCFETRVIYCLYGKQQDVLPAWHEGPPQKPIQECPF